MISRPGKNVVACTTKLVALWSPVLMVCWSDAAYFNDLLSQQEGAEISNVTLVTLSEHDVQTQLQEMCEHVWISAKMCPKMFSDLPLGDNGRKTQRGAEECEPVELKTGWPSFGNKQIRPAKGSWGILDHSFFQRYSWDVWVWLLLRLRWRSQQILWPIDPEYRAVQKG